MAITKTPVTLLASGSTSAPGATTRTSPGVTGTTVDCRSYYGGELTYRITNAVAPGSPCILLFQSSHDGTNWYDYYSVGGDVAASSSYSGSVTLDRGVMYIRAIAFNNTTNAVTVEAFLQAISGV